MSEPQPSDAKDAEIERLRTLLAAASERLKIAAEAMDRMGFPDQARISSMVNRDLGGGHMPSDHRQRAGLTSITYPLPGFSITYQGPPLRKAWAAYRLWLRLAWRRVGIGHCPDPLAIRDEVLLIIRQAAWRAGRN